MMRTALVAAVLAVAIGAGNCRSAPDSQRLFDSAVQALWRGQMPEARAFVDRGLTQSDSIADSVWSWKFRLLRAEILLVSGEREGVADLVASSPPPGDEFGWVRAKRRYLEGQLHIAQGKAAEAIPMLRDAEQMAVAASASDVALDAQALVGQALLRLSKWGEAERTLNALVARANQANDSYRKAVALVNLGMGPLTRNRFDEALPFFEAVISMAELSPQLVYARALINAGHCYTQLGNVNRALAALDRAVKTHEQRGTPLYLEQALGELGTTYLVARRYQEGIPHLQRALEIAKGLKREADVAVWTGNLANAFIQLGRWQEAEAFNRQARTLKADRRNAPYLLLNDAYIAEGRGHWNDAARVFQDVLELGVDDVNFQWPAHAGLARVEMAAGRHAAAIRHYETALAAIERSRSDLQRTDSRLSIQTRRIEMYQRYVDVLVGERQFDRALLIADSSRGRVLAERQNVNAPTRVTPVDLRRTAAQLDAVLLFYWIGDRSYAWQVTKDRIRLVPLSVNVSQVDALVKSYQQSLVTSLTDPVNGASPAGDEIYAKLVAPVAESIPAGSRVVIVPDGALTRINFESLPVPGPKRHYWIEDVEVAIAPSLGTLNARVQPRGRKQSDSVLLIGDPVSSDPSFPQLRHASAEMSAVSKAFAGRTAVYRADQATPARYRDAMPEQFSVVHFTAHAAANAESPLDSAVILSKDGSGYKLYARDVAEQPLSADLVTISACRSAGDRTYAGEGLVGFAWAFLRAGAQRVIAGLWDVDDRSTADLMGHVYADIAQGRTPSAALRNAKLAMIARGGAAAKPYYWAPFQLFIGSRVVP